MDGFDVRFLMCVFLLLAAVGCSRPEAKQKSPKTQILVRPKPEFNLPVDPKAQKLAFELMKDEIAWRDRYGYLHSDRLDRLVGMGEKAVGAVVAVWCHLLEKGGPEGLRYRLLEALLRLASKEAVPFLNYVLREGENRERILAARCALEWGDERNVAALIEQMDNPDVRVLCACAAALRRITGCYFGLEKRFDEATNRNAAKRWKLWYQTQIRSAGP